MKSLDYIVGISRANMGGGGGGKNKKKKIFCKYRSMKSMRNLEFKRLMF